MTILDTFFLDFKTQNVAQTSNDIKNLDKQISDLAAKGNKRNEEEQKQLKILRKQRLEATQDLKDQVRTTDALGDSFGSLATKIIGVGAALFGLNEVKNGVLSAVKNNVSTANQAFIGGQDPNDLRTIAAIVESAGGSGEGAKALIDSMRHALTQRGLPFTNPLGVLNQANKDVQGRTKTDQARVLEQLYGINDEALESQLEKSVEEWQKIVELKKKSTALTAKDYADAVEFEGALTSLDQTWTKFYTKLGTATFPALEFLLSIMTDILTVSEKAKASAEFVFGGGGKIYNPHGGSFFASNRGVSSQYSTLSSETQNPPTASIAPKTGNAAIDFWLGQGYTLNGAIGMAAQEQGESSGNPNARKMDSKGRMHYGLYQFDPTRRAEILAGTNIDVATASAEDQRKAAAWDAHRRGDDVRINQGTTPEGSSNIANSYFEVSGEDPRRREMIAHQLAMQWGAGAQNSGAGSELNVKIDKVEINTQATDANGIGRDFAQAFDYHLSLHLDNLYSDTNDGIGK